MGLTARPAVCIVGVLLLAAALLAAAEGEWDAPESCATPVSVEAACRGASDTHHGVDYEHCVRSLNADARSAEASASAGIHGLAVLATRIAVDHAASTEAKIEDLAELEAEAEGAASRARFDHCLEQYGGAADLLRDALDNLQANVYGLAMQQLMAALGASRSCEDAWRGAPPRAIPVAAHDREYERLAHIAIGFTHAAAK